MNVEFERSFYRNLNKIKDPILLRKVENIIIKLESVKSLIEIPDANKLTGFKNYYKIRIGDYRIGFEKMSSTRIRIILIANRKEIYKLFP